MYIFCLIVCIISVGAVELNGICRGGLHLDSTASSIEQSYDIFLEEGMYVMEMTDSYGDGWGHGFLHLWDPSGTTDQLSTRKP